VISAGGGVISGGDVNFLTDVAVNNCTVCRALTPQMLSEEQSTGAASFGFMDASAGLAQAKPINE
jgi:hypothetical protein